MQIRKETTNEECLTTLFQLFLSNVRPFAITSQETEFPTGEMRSCCLGAHSFEGLDSDDIGNYSETHCDDYVFYGSKIL